MKYDDLRSIHVKIFTISFLSLGIFGLMISINTFFISEQISIDYFGVDRNSSVGLSVIMMSIFFGIGMAFAVKRREMFKYYNTAVCGITGSKMYENDDQTKKLCPDHGEQGYFHFILPGDEKKRDEEIEETKNMIDTLQERLKELTGDKK